MHVKLRFHSGLRVDGKLGAYYWHGITQDYSGGFSYRRILVGERRDTGTSYPADTSVLGKLVVRVKWLD